MSKRNNMERAIEIYQNSRDGQEAVLKAVDQKILLVDRWAMCDSCETESPIWDNTCLICSEQIGQV